MKVKLQKDGNFFYSTSFQDFFSTASLPGVSQGRGSAGTRFGSWREREQGTTRSSNFLCQRAYPNDKAKVLWKQAEEGKIPDKCFRSIALFEVIRK